MDPSPARARKSPLLLYAALLVVVAAGWRLIGVADWNPFAFYPTIQFESAITARTMWRLAPGFAARLDAARAVRQQLIGACREVGERVGPAGAVICLSDSYGLDLEYYGWVRAAHWPGAVDVDYMTKGQLNTFDPVRHLRSLREATGAAAFVVLDFDEFRGQPWLERMLTQQGFRRAFADDRYILFTHPGG